METLPAQIWFWNRREGRQELEQVYGADWIRRLYGTKLGRKVSGWVSPKICFSRLYGIYQSSPWSKRAIEPFIKKFQIPMEEYQRGPYLSFNEFFTRRFRKGTRPFVSGKKEFPAFAEARYFAYEKVDAEQKFPVKGNSLSAVSLLGSVEKAQPFIGGPLLLARLCPIDYHRFHFPDSGKWLQSYSIHGDLHSVNPVALHFKGDILATNEREVSILETENFGKLAYIEVGALCVGKIVQTFQRPSFKRGDEKGYFLFGASTVIVIGEPGKWVPDLDLLMHTRQGMETLVRLGEKVATGA